MLSKKTNLMTDTTNGCKIKQNISKAAHSGRKIFKKSSKMAAKCSGATIGTGRVG